MNPSRAPTSRSVAIAPPFAATAACAARPSHRHQRDREQPEGSRPRTAAAARRWRPAALARRRDRRRPPRAPRPAAAGPGRPGRARPVGLDLDQQRHRQALDRHVRPEPRLEQPLLLGEVDHPDRPHARGGAQHLERGARLLLDLRPRGRRSAASRWRRARPASSPPAARPRASAPAPAPRGRRARRRASRRRDRAGSAAARRPRDRRPRAQARAPRAPAPPSRRDPPARSGRRRARARAPARGRRGARDAGSPVATRTVLPMRLSSTSSASSRSRRLPVDAGRRLVGEDHSGLWITARASAARCRPRPRELGRPGAGPIARARPTRAAPAGRRRDPPAATPLDPQRQRDVVGHRQVLEEAALLRQHADLRRSAAIALRSRGATGRPKNRTRPADGARSR